MRVVVLLLLAVPLAVLEGCGSKASAAATTAVKEDTVFEFVAKADQNDLSIASYGYLSHVAGLNDADLFSAAFPAWNESTAKFTFVTSTTLNARFVTPGVFSIAGSGDTTYYFTNSPSGNFANPASFAAGTAIATSSGRYSDVNAVVSAGLGVINGSGEVTQNTATAVTVAGASFTLGAAALPLRVSYSGLATRTSPTANTSSTFFSGRATTIR